MNMIIKPREYQDECVQVSIKAIINQKRKRLLIVLPTGSGKTIVLSIIAKKLNMRTLILAHRDELIIQAAQKLSLVWPDAEIGFIKGNKNEFDKQIMIASTQTLANPMRRANIPPLGLIIYDEAHHAMAPINKQILADLMGENTVLIGVTATPNRSDDQGLGHLFAESETDGPIYEKSILEMISEGYLSPIRGIKGNLQVELSNIRKNHGDYELSSLSKAMNTPSLNHATVQLWESCAKDRKTIVFAVDVKHSEELTRYFKHYGYKADYIHGGLSPKKRAEVLKNFEQNEIQILINCAVLTEGFDEPSVDCVYLVRPTTSNSLYIQMVGRGLRLYPGKKDCLIIDGVKNTEKHNLITLTDLFPISNKRRAEFGNRGPELVDKDKQDNSVEEIIINRAWFEAQETEIMRSTYDWKRAGDGGFRLSLIGGHIHLRKKPDGWYPYFVEKGGKETLLYEKPLNAEYAMGIAESKIRELHLDRFARKDANWRKEKANQNQIAALRRWGYKITKELTKGEASDILSRFIEEKEQKMKSKS